MEAAAAEYSRRWLPNALAVADLTEEGFGKNSRAFTLNLKLVQASTPAWLLAAGSQAAGPVWRGCLFGMSRGLLHSCFGPCCQLAPASFA